ncbi:glycosyltransferase family 2 protein [Candidatus Amarolinea aalborgensis]|jgi:cellulose synthase/poly-beta-1,6-N-acetylglucosamine synthase-like glycosyltransferase|uniref:glycosyltransferase family 2 protein n=1 Tax=Candidatus Amarolinea aalborgensis TaxID=2249329 RepID=UPI003BFA0C56
MTSLLTVSFTIVLTLIGLGLAYLYILLAFGGKRTTRRDLSHRFLRLAVAIPAHNEEAVIGASVRRLLQSNYPRECFDVHVAADYCADDTASAAAAAGALIHPREVGPRGRKGYALGWLFWQLLADPKLYDAIVVFDADSRVDQQFLRQTNNVLNAGARVIQGRHVISNPSDGAFSALADADMRLNNRIRNQAKANLGLSARLMGDAMCFHRSVLENYPWAEASSLAEDREYGIYLTIQGVRVVYEPDAVSAGQATTMWKDATPQRLRWYGGVVEIQKQYLRPLLAAALRKRNAAAFDLALDLLLPPFSTLAVLAAMTTLLSAVLTLQGLIPRFLFFGAVSLTASAVAFPFVGLVAERAPRSAFRALIRGPVYALWRVWVGARALLLRGNLSWVRTRRTEEMESPK